MVSGYLTQAPCLHIRNLTLGNIKSPINGNLHNLDNISNLNNLKLSVNTSAGFYMILWYLSFEFQ